MRSLLDLNEFYGPFSVCGFNGIDDDMNINVSSSPKTGLYLVTCEIVFISKAITTSLC